jgi:ferritin
MISAKMQTALNKQINAELFSAYQYLAMSAYLETKNLPGMASWMRSQGQEEMLHAMKIYDYIQGVAGTVALAVIDKPDAEYGSALETFETGLAHEKKVTSMIHALYAQATEEKDYPTQLMLQWFIDEQVEEESSFGLVVEQFKMAGDTPIALLTLDGRLGARQAE